MLRICFKLLCVGFSNRNAISFCSLPKLAGMLCTLLFVLVSQPDAHAAGFEIKTVATAVDKLNTNSTSKDELAPRFGEYTPIDKNVLVPNTKTNSKAPLAPSATPTVFFTESFETPGPSYDSGAQNVTVIVAPTNFGTTAIWNRTDGSDHSNISGTPYSGENGNFYWAAEATLFDSNGNVTATERVMDIMGIDISGQTNIKLLGLFAAEGNHPSGPRFDNNDYLRVQYQIDNGGYQNAIWFSQVQNGTSNEPIGRDIDFDNDASDDNDGTGPDAVQLSNPFSELEYAIPGTGNTLDLRILVDVDGTSEEVAFDNLRLSGEASAPNALATVIDSATGDLIITEVGGDTDDNLTINFDGTNFTITDANNTLGDGGLGFITGGDSGTLTVAPDASFSGGIIFNTLGGDDMLTVNFGGGANFSKTIRFNGGETAETNGDKLALQGGGTFADATYGFNNVGSGDAHNGTIDITGNSTITFTGLEPVTSSITNTNVTLNYSTDPETIAVSNAGDSQTKVTSTIAESVTFNVPSGILQINGGNTGVNTVNVSDLVNPYPATIDINGGEKGDINLNGAITFAAGKSLLVDAATINTPNTGSDIATSTTGTVNLTATQNILMSSGSNLTTVNGGITLSANLAGTGTGNFKGLVIDNATIETTGTGNISLSGAGGDDASTGTHIGVNLNSGANVTSTASSANAGMITISGAGGVGQFHNRGVLIEGANTKVRTVNGNIHIFGTGGTGGSNGNIGVEINSGGSVQSSSSGKITITGTGGSGTINRGVSLKNNVVGGTVGSITGDITIIGSVSTGLANTQGVEIASDGDVVTTGSANITITGSAGTDKDDIRLNNTNSIIGGNLATGNINLIGNKINLIAGSIQSSGNLTITPRTASTTIGLGSGTGTLNLDDTEIMKLANGFSSITIGDATAGDIDINTATFNDPVILITGGEIHDNAGTDINMAGGDAATANGTAAPGQSPGILNVTGNFAFADNSTFEVEIGGTTPGVGAGFHDQIDATGSVTIGAMVTLNESSFSGYTPSGGESFEIINRSGGTGMFDGFADGAEVSADFLGSGLSATITYSGGDGDDVVINVEVPPTTTTVSRDGNDLKVEDTGGDNTADMLTISTDGTDVIINDPNNLVGLGTGLPNATGNGTNTINVPLTDFSGGIIVNTLGGDDKLTVDFGGGANFGRTIRFNGGETAETDGDELALTGGGTFTDATYGFNNVVSGDIDNGTIEITGNSTITYTGLEPITSTITNTNVTLNYSSSLETIAVSNPGSNQTKVTSTKAEDVTFNDPSGILQINGGNTGANTVNVSDLANPYPATIDINGGDAGDIVNLNGAITLTAGDSLTIDAKTVNLNNTTSDIVTSGPGKVRLTTTRNILMKTGSSITTVNGGINLNGNQDATADAGTFSGIQLTNATIQSTGSGPITLNGRGGSSNSNNASRGVMLGSSSIVISSASGNVTINGIGGTGTGNDHHGILVGRGCDISVSLGNMNVTGTGAGGNAMGVRVSSGAAPPGRLLSTGTGGITVTGTGSGAFEGLAIFVNGSFIGGSSAAGPIILIVDDIKFSNGLVQSTGSLTIQPRTASTTIGLGSGSGTLNLDDTELGFLADGFSSITIGNATAGDIDINTAKFNDPVTFITNGEIHDNTTNPDVNMASGDLATIDGTAAPGQSPGIFKIFGKLAFADNSSYEVEIGGTIAGVGNGFHDQVDATGMVTIGSNVTLTPLASGNYSPTGGESFEIINRTGGTGTFKDLVEGASVDANFLGSGLTATITYKGGDGDDVVINVQVPTTTTVSKDGNDLKVEDTGGDNTADMLKISTDGTDVIINDPNNLIGVGTGLPNATGNGTNTVNVPLTDFSGGIIVNTLGGDDKLTIDFGGGANFGRTIRFNGGETAETDGDELALTGGGTFTDATYGFNNVISGDIDNGTIDITGNSKITFTGLEPVTSSITNTNVTLNYSTDVETIAVSNAGSNQTRVTSTKAEDVTFNDPSGILQINGGDTGVNTIDVGALVNPYQATIDINGGDGGDTVNINGAITLAEGDSLTADALTINTPNTNSDIATSGTGTVRLTATRNILMSSGSSIATVNGGITLSANTAGTTIGNFKGLEANSATIQTTGTGNIMLIGKGAKNNTTDFSQHGVFLNNTSVSSTSNGGGAGMITINGTGGDGAGFTNAVLLEGSSTAVMSVNGAILITGTGVNGTSKNNHGVHISNGGTISSSGTDASAATITINGTGGVGTITNYGVSLDGSSTNVTSVNGAISLTGIGGNGSGNNNRGVNIENDATVQVTTGMLTVNGTAVAGQSSGVRLSGNNGGRLVSLGTGSIAITAQGNTGRDDLRAGSDSFIGGSLATGAITINANSIDFSGTLTVESDGALVIQPRTAGTTIGLGGGTGTLNLDDTELGLLQDGFSSITIGDATAGDIDINTATFNDPVTLITGGEIHDNAGTDINMAGGDAATADGTTAPGQSPGILNVSGNFAFADNSTFEVEIGGTSPGSTATDHDQIDATGTATIGTGVTLTPSSFGGYVPKVGESFEIINRTGGTGTFNNMAEGAEVSANFLGSGLSATITYVGGDGDDVVINVEVAALTVTISDASMSENGGATTATVSRNSDTTNPLTVNLQSDDTSEATVLATVTIAADETTSAPFVIDAVDDLLLDGTQTVTITASATDHANGTDTIDITDDEVAALTVTIAADDISENGGATTATVSRNTDTTNPLTVNLQSDDTSEATVLATVTIAADQTTSAPFVIDAVDDLLLDGTQTVTITASATDHANGTDTIDITDDDVEPECIITSVTDTNQVKTEHTVTVTVKQNNVVQPGVIVTFEVFKGPNLGTSGTGATPTNASGQTTFTYTSNGTVGTDSIKVSGTVNGIPFECFAEKVWVNNQCTLEPVTAQNQVGHDHTVTATVTQNGNPVQGVTVNFDVFKGPNSEDSSNSPTDANGEASFTYNGDGGVGVDSIRASGTINGVPFECVAEKVWVEAEVLPPEDFSAEDLFPFYNLQTHQFSFNLRIQNTSSKVMVPPLLVQFTEINTDPPGPPVTIANADGGGNAVGAFYDYSNLLGPDNQLLPNEFTGSKTWIFDDPGDVNFTFMADVLATFQTAPFAKAITAKGTLRGSVDVKNGTVTLLIGTTTDVDDLIPFEIPSEFTLHQNYPNPFNPETTIRFGLPQVSEVTINIYNLQGQLVRTLVQEMMQAGSHEIVWDARDDLGNSMPSGVYLYRIKAGAFMEVRKLMLIR